MSKPVIGIISSLGNVEKGGYKKNIQYVNSDYVNLIHDRGGIVVFIPPNSLLHDIRNILDFIDGLLIIGGEDISPACYEESTEHIPNRDILEIESYKYVRDKGKPILGICRGMQIINVAEGGTLCNIENETICHSIENDGWINYHPIRINRESKFYDIIRCDNYVMPSVHHQRINDLGKKIVVSSTAEDNVIETIEVMDSKFIMGLQGHIEKCLNTFNKYEKIIKLFIREAANEK